MTSSLFLTFLTRRNCGLGRVLAAEAAENLTCFYFLTFLIARTLHGGTAFLFFLCRLLLRRARNQKCQKLAEAGSRKDRSRKDMMQMNSPPGRRLGPGRLADEHLGFHILIGVGIAQ
jgi:hypothetical protein